MKNRMTVVVAFIGAVLLSLVAPISAHHAMVAEFNLAKPITLKGTLTRMEWVNPHGWIYLNTTNAEGLLETWKIETGSPFRMEKRGLKKTDFRIGAEVIINGFAAKDGSLTGAGFSITFPDREAAFPAREASFVLGR